MGVGGQYQRLQTLRDILHLPLETQGNQIAGLTGRSLSIGFSTLLFYQ
jgi:hypothetical protein